MSITTTTGGGQLDLANNKLVIDYASTSPLDTVRQYLLAGRNGGAWNGLGIISSTAAALYATAPYYAIGYVEAASLASTTWGGQNVDATAVITSYTYYGDTTLDGDVDVDDIALTDRGFRRGYTGWLNGDFNYDNVIDSNDYDLLNAAYAFYSSQNPHVILNRGSGGGEEEFGPLLPPVDGFTDEFIAGRVAQFGVEYADALAALLAQDEVEGGMSVMSVAVPEPTCGALLVVVGATAAVRRRRRRRSR